MTTFQIEQFSPKKAEMQALAESSKGLTINGVEDLEGYKKVHEARIKLKSTRIEITKNGKALREDAIAFQKKVIELEKELVGIIEPVETELEQKEKTIDAEKERLRRVSLLPSRRSVLEDIGYTATDEELMCLNNDEFKIFLDTKKNEIEAKRLQAEKDALEQQQRKVKEEQRRIEEEKRNLEEEKQKANTEQARVEELKKEPEATTENNDQANTQNDDEIVRQFIEEVCGPSTEETREKYYAEFNRDTRIIKIYKKIAEKQL